MGKTRGIIRTRIHKRRNENDNLRLCVGQSARAQKDQQETPLNNDYDQSIDVNSLFGEGNKDL